MASLTHSKIVGCAASGTRRCLMSDLRLLRSATLASMGEEDFRRAVRSVAACSSIATDGSGFVMW